MTELKEGNTTQGIVVLLAILLMAFSVLSMLLPRTVEVHLRKEMTSQDMGSLQQGLQQMFSKMDQRISSLESKKTTNKQ